MNFFMEQLQKEKNYIETKYLSSIVQYDNEVTIEEDFIVKKVTLNNISYKMYKKNNEEFDILLIPDSKELLKDNFDFITDFDNIIKYKKNKDGLHFCVISKKCNCVNLFNYDFYTNESGYSTGNYFNDTFFDKNYIIQFESLKSNTSIPSFLYDLNTRKLTNSGYRLDRIKRNKNETKLNKINEISLLEAYQLYDSCFNEIDDNTSPILEIFESMQEKKVKTRI